jgi:hypothetical protein
VRVNASQNLLSVSLIQRWRASAIRVTASSHFEVTNALTAVTRARENLVEGLVQLNAARVNLASATGSLNQLQ